MPLPAKSLRHIRLSPAFFFSSRRRHTRWTGDWSSDVCSSDLDGAMVCQPLGSGEDAWQTIAPSVLPFGADWPLPLDMSLAEMERVGDAFVGAAKRAIRIEIGRASCREEGRSRWST